jgi:hypothetical protein
MVAITVILGAVVGGFVLGGGIDTGEPAPQVALTVSDAEENLTTNPGFTPGPKAYQDVLVIRHEGGPTLSTHQLNITLTNGSKQIAVYSRGENYDPNIGPKTGGLDKKADYGVYNVSGDPDTFGVGGTIRLAENRPPGKGPPYAVLEIPDGTYRITIVHVESDSVLLRETITLS